MTEIGLLTQEARLALAVRAQVASIRADQAAERAALLRKQMAPFDEAAGRFERLYGHEPDLQDAADAARMLPLLTGTADVSQETVLAAVEAGGVASERAGVAAAAMQALRAARTAEQGDTVLEWIGVDGATYERALQEALTADPEKARESRLRRLARHQGPFTHISKSRTRNPRSIDYGKWYLVDGNNNSIIAEFSDIDAAEEALTE